MCPPVTERQVDGYPPPGTLDDLLRFELLEATGERCRGRVAVERRVQQTMASWATAGAVGPAGNIAVGQSNSTTFLRPVTSGHVHGEGTPRHRGRTTWIWDVEFTDDEGRLCAISRVTLAVRSAPT